MDEIGVGIVGCGNISTIYLTNLPHVPGVKVRACADMRPEVAQAQGGRFGVEAMPVDALLARSDIDIVVNLTVPAAHAAVALAALTAGKHVFSEKPLAVDVDLGRTVLEEAKKRKLMVGCAPDTFLGAGGRLSRKLLDEGAVGRILAGTAFVMSHGMEHWHPDPEFFFKKGAGPVLDVGPYYITTLVNLLGSVARVHAVTSTGFPERIITAAGPRKGDSIKVETPTTAFALLEFAGGAQIVFGATWDVWKQSHPPIELYGTEGTLRVPDPNFYGGVVETSARGGEWVAHDSREDAARPRQLAGERADARELSRARRRRHGGGASERPLAPRERRAGAPCPRSDAGGRGGRQHDAGADSAAGGLRRERRGCSSSRRPLPARHRGLRVRLRRSGRPRRSLRRRSRQRRSRNARRRPSGRRRRRQASRCKKAKRPAAKKKPAKKVRRSR